jgi:hypothetical protein
MLGCEMYYIYIVLLPSSGSSKLPAFEIKLDCFNHITIQLYLSALKFVLDLQEIETPSLWE